MPRLISQLAAAEGACCIWDWWRRYRQWRAQALADYLGVSKETVKYWRREIREGKCECAQSIACRRFDYCEPTPPPLRVESSDT